MLTASDMNTYVRDNFNAVAGGPALIKRYTGSSVYSITATNWVAVDTTNLRLAGFTVLAGCDVRLTARLPRVTPSGNTIELSFMRDGTEITGSIPVACDNAQECTLVIRDSAPAPGSHNYDLCAQVNTGTATIEARSSYKLELWAENVPAGTFT